MRRISSFNIRIGESPFFFVSDHAGKSFPEHLGNLGIKTEDQERHIAYDIGIKEVGRLLAPQLNATLVEQHFSRLVIDCNRQLERNDSIPEVSDGTVIFGNQNLSQEQIEWRHKNVFEPYHQKISELLRNRITAKKPTLLVSLHSFTPKLKTSSCERPWDIGLLFHHDLETSRLFKQKLLQRKSSLRIGENQPYYLDLEREHTVPTHAEAHAIPALEIEIRQDLLQNKKSFNEITTLLYKSFLALQKDLWGALPIQAETI